MEAQMQLYQGVGEVRAGADHPRPEGEEQGGVTETRIVRLIEPLKERRRILLASKEMYQVTQDLEDEIVSVPFYSPYSLWLYININVYEKYSSQ